MEGDLDDKVFNLQLYVQKLEQELLLYRKGTTRDDLIDIIEEKNKEIEQLKCDLIRSNDERADYYKKITVLITSYKELEKEFDNFKSTSDVKLSEYKSEILHLSTEQNLNIEVCVKTKLEVRI